ncbi:hypothetical protein [Megasphaera vaginalis (ex Srinivasan et al. 2021)]|uniref:Dipeptidylpeptidase IV N-terminal domain-containing protein n=1 Tax=Megasphaera vaginalis (ex Srinivasan et al. 2021) TaxID=1111454 RepID=U7UL57_9FIRM|nr:hypothetical protein [Megasphaera vaginalis (ex Srinivasan et al. 2021)]ERT59203.1 hypothetical protein HMPREF1250_1375 [Megasphaera vaginalis (ex Srinivasan et al. 2021)]
MKIGNVLLTFIAGVAIQAGVYYYLDSFLFAPTSDYKIGGTNQQEALGFGVEPNGQSYYSYDKRFMAVISNENVSIYEAGKKGNPQRISLHGRNVSFFEWLPDRDLAIFATYGRSSKTGAYGVFIAQYNPQAPDRELDTEIEDVPRDSKITDVAYSTATNVIYMKLQIEEGRYRIYRTDANYDTRRIPVQAEDIGKIAVFYDQDILFYDNLKRGIVYMLEGATGTWREISPNGNFRLVGIDGQEIYIAEVNRDGKAVAAYRGRLKKGFTKIATYQTPEEFSSLTLDSMHEASDNMDKEK